MPTIHRLSVYFVPSIMGADFELEVKLGIRDPFDFILVIDEIPASDVSHHDAVCEPEWH
jgi:hypothetical protein